MVTDGAHALVERVAATIIAGSTASHGPADGWVMLGREAWSAVGPHVVELAALLFPHGLYLSEVFPGPDAVWPNVPEVREVSAYWWTPDGLNGCSLDLAPTAP